MTKIFGMLVLLILATPTQAGGSLDFIDQMRTDWDIAFEGAPGELTRLSMIEEMGLAHPSISCPCNNTRDPYEASACKLGLLGGIYLLTSVQHTTHRSSMDIWRIPNASLTIEPYAYFKEMQQGISCEDSLYAAKFPTRRARAGEGPAPLTRADVCHAWRDYFTADMKEAQHLLWKAHTYSLLHSYYQHYTTLEYAGQKGRLPRKEYRMWMGWNRLVGDFVPTVNPRSCSIDVIALAHQLMPNCLLGTRRPDGRKCRGENPPHGHSDTLSLITALFQTTLATEDFSKAIEAMSSHIEN